MRTNITFKPIALLLAGFAAFTILFTSCEKIPGHTINTGATAITKAGTVTFSLNDTTNTLSTVNADTVSFNTTTVPVTTVTAKNGQKYLGIVFSFGGKTAGTYAMTSCTITVPTKNGGVLTTTNSGPIAGSVVATSLDFNSGVLVGSFTTTVRNSSNVVDTVKGTVNIQQ